MKIARIVSKCFHRIFTPKIDYEWLYSSVWNKEKSDYLRKKIKGKKSIPWYEKRGKGSYFDKRLTSMTKYVAMRNEGDDPRIKEKL